MKTRTIYTILVGVIMVASGCSTGDGMSIDEVTGEVRGDVSQAAVCPGPAAAGNARCHARVVTDPAGKPVSNSTPSGYTPADLRAAYNLTASGSSAQTIAIVDANDNPNAESDLGVYRAQFGLPPCTTANGCFRKVDQNGGTSYPRGDVGWGQEIDLDIEMASAICPGCNILLVEADSASMANLGAAVNTAVKLGATVVSNSYGGNEYAGELADSDAYFNHPGIAITVSSGDSGYGVEFPASSQYVTAVGGTHLTKSGNSWSETAWSGAGSGCSAYVAKPSWQTDAGCGNRTVADVAAVADPYTGVAVYDSYGHGPRNKGWLVFGGTSVAAPVIGGVYALAGNGGSASLAYSHTSALNDVTSGNNGSCGGSYLCTAGAGYDGPTGNGTPNGTGAF